MKSRVLLVALALLVVLVLAARSPSGCRQLDLSITDPSRYAELLREFEGSVLVEHFPEAVPVDATDTRLYYLPKFMQGCMILQLKVTLPPEHVRGIDRFWRSSAIQSIRGGDQSGSVSLPNGAPLPWCSFFDSYNPFPESYELHVIEAVPGGSTDSEWNHGHTRGVAIEAGTSTVVYWAEYW